MENPEIFDESAELLLSLTADVVAAYVGNNSIRASELPLLISEVHSAFKRHVEREEAPVVVEKPKPAVNPKKSVTDDYIICLEDGKKFKSLKRHLMTHYSMTLNSIVKSGILILTIRWLLLTMQQRVRVLQRRWAWAASLRTHNRI